MTPAIRMFFAFLSACGLTASFIVYIESFSAAYADTVFHSWRWAILVLGCDLPPNSAHEIIRHLPDRIA